MQATAIRGYSFAEFTLDLGRRRLSRDDDTLPLSGRSFEVLAYLLANRDRMVPKRELLEAVWPRMVVEENNLTQAISNLRRVLGDSREAPQFIATVAGRGYQFVGDAQPLRVAVPAAPAVEPLRPAVVPPVPEPASLPAHEAAGHVSRPVASPVSRRSLLLGAGALAAAALVAGAWRWSRRDPTQLPASIAVLPFKPLLAESRNEAIEIGIAELLINRLSVLPGMVVTPLSSVRRFSDLDRDPLQAGRDLEVAAVVDGTVQIQRDQVRLTARLLEVASGRAIWSGDFTEKFGDFFVLQDALVTQLVAALAVEVPAEVRQRLVAHATTDTEAWQLYANGRYQLERREPEAFTRAMRYFEGAIERDPRFALAITGLSEAWALSAIFYAVPPSFALQQARTAAQRALDIAPQLPEALTALGHVLTQYDHDWSGGRGLYRQALAVAPDAAWTHAFLALNLIQSGPASQAREHIYRALQLEPAVMPFMALGGFVDYHARDFDASRQRLSGIVESAPEAVMPRQFLARTLLAQGDAAGALGLLEGRNQPAPGSYSTLGRAYAVVGNVDAARAEVARVEAEGAKGFGVGFDLALLHVALGERERALDALERALADSSQMVGYINVEPALDPIRDEPRLRSVARSVGLPDAPAARL
jgi:DNA-binding winged helix-turn-helix (wHTH) protein/TolB-like protein/Tfp pilus assembly protein PilF